MHRWLLVRIAGIVVGIATMLRLASSGGWVKYDSLFQIWMDKLSGLLELGFLTDIMGPLLHWSFECARNLGFNVPGLHDEWRPAWVLSALMFSAMGRQVPTWWMVPVTVAGSILVAVIVGLTGAIQLVIGLAACFAIGVFSGTDSRASGALAFSFWAIISKFPNSADVAAVGLVTAAAWFLVLQGLSENSADGRRGVLANPQFNAGIDILFVMACALATASLSADPPIW